MSGGGPQKGLTEAQMLRDFAQSRFQQLAREVVWRLTRHSASKIVCGPEISVRTLWDEYCYCAHFSRTDPLGERLLREHVRVMVGIAVEDLAASEEHILWLRFGEDELDATTCRPLVYEAVEEALWEMAGDRDIDHMLPEWER
jgi:hypothetical protein